MHQVYPLQKCIYMYMFKCVKVRAPALMYRISGEFTMPLASLRAKKSCPSSNDMPLKWHAIFDADSNSVGQVQTNMHAGLRGRAKEGFGKEEEEEDVNEGEEEDLGYGEGGEERGNQKGIAKETEEQAAWLIGKTDCMRRPVYLPVCVCKGVLAFMAARFRLCVCLRPWVCDRAHA